MRDFSFDAILIPDDPTLGLWEFLSTPTQSWFLWLVLIVNVILAIIVVVALLLGVLGLCVSLLLLALVVTVGLAGTISVTTAFCLGHVLAAIDRVPGRSVGTGGLIVAASSFVISKFL